MNISNLVIMILILTVAYKFLFPSVETKIETEIEYRYGDTLTVVKYESVDFVEVYIHDTLRVPHVRADTVYVDSTGKHHAKADFEFFKDSVSVKGIVRYDEPNFLLEALKVIYPRFETTVVDTIYNTTTITKKPPIFANEWFWGTIVALLVIILQI